MEIYELREAGQNVTPEYALTITKHNLKIAVLVTTTDIWEVQVSKA